MTDAPNSNPPVPSRRRDDDDNGKENSDDNFYSSDKTSKEEENPLLMGAMPLPRDNNDHDYELASSASLVASSIQQPDGTATTDLSFINKRLLDQQTQTVGTQAQVRPESGDQITSPDFPQQLCEDQILCDVDRIVDGLNQSDVGEQISTLLPSETTNLDRPGAFPVRGFGTPATSAADFTAIDSMIPDATVTSDGDHSMIMARVVDDDELEGQIEERVNQRTREIMETLRSNYIDAQVVENDDNMMPAAAKSKRRRWFLALAALLVIVAAVVLGVTVRVSVTVKPTASMPNATNSKNSTNTTRERIRT
jgi:hypothetical protein